MYVKRLELSRFRCFESVDVGFHYPGRPLPEDVEPVAFPNMTLILGDNGAGKSSLLKAISVGILGTVLSDSGFRPFRLVRLSSILGVGQGSVRVTAEVGAADREPEGSDYVFQAVLEHQFQENYFVHEKTAIFSDGVQLPVPDGLRGAKNAAFLLCGYGSSRRSEDAQTYDEAARLKSRSARYQRVASLFEEGFTLIPFSPWLTNLASPPDPHHHFGEVIELLAKLLEGSEIALSSFSGRVSSKGSSYDAVFTITADKTQVHFSELSDGYRTYLSWLGDLLKQLVDVTPQGSNLVETAGVVLLDEVDLHLHPSWQRRILGRLSSTFPKLQFIVTSHSPILAASVPRENVLMVDRSAEGPAVVTWPSKDYYGRSVDEVLTGDLFGLSSTLTPELEARAEAAEERRIDLAQTLAKNPTPEAADAYLRELTKTWSE